MKKILKYLIILGILQSNSNASSEPPTEKKLQSINISIETPIGKEIGKVDPKDFKHLGDVNFRQVANHVENFGLIPEGKFTMGSIKDDNITKSPRVEVYVSEFFMAKTETTLERWSEVRDWALENGYSDLQEGYAQGPKYPVSKVSWFNMTIWCNAASEMEGLNPCYYDVNGNVVRSGNITTTCDWSANGYRLPTEAEWEKAAKGGKDDQRYPWGNTIDHSNANYRSTDSSFGDIETKKGYNTNFDNFSPVASFQPNGYGLYDTSGNVWELCWDKTSGSTPVVLSGTKHFGYTKDPVSKSGTTYRMMKGGSAYETAVKNMSCFRLWYKAHVNKATSRGFRVARANVEALNPYFKIDHNGSILLLRKLTEFDLPSKVLRFEAINKLGEKIVSDIVVNISTKLAPDATPPKTGPGNSPDLKCKETIAKLEAEIKNQKIEITDLTTLIIELRKQVADLNSSNLALTTEVSGLKNQVNNLNGQVASLTSENGELKGQVTNLREDNGNLQGNITSLNEQLVESDRIAKTPFVHGWIYTHDHGWLHIDSENFPIIYKNDTQTWHFYEQGSINPRYFYNFNEQKWEAWDSAE